MAKRIELLKWLNADKERFLYPSDAIEVPVANEESINIVKKLYKQGCKKVELELNSDDALDVIFITVGPTFPKELVKFIFDLRPDEFDEEKPNVFRLWWD